MSASTRLEDTISFIKTLDKELKNLLGERKKHTWTQSSSFSEGPLSVEKERALYLC